MKDWRKLKACVVSFREIDYLIEKLWLSIWTKLSALTPCRNKLLGYFISLTSVYSICSQRSTQQDIHLEYKNNESQWNLQKQLIMNKDNKANSLVTCRVKGLLLSKVRVVDVTQQDNESFATKQSSSANSKHQKYFKLFKISSLFYTLASVIDRKNSV